MRAASSGSHQPMMRETTKVDSEATTLAFGQATNKHSSADPDGEHQEQDDDVEWVTHRPNLPAQWRRYAQPAPIRPT